MLLGNGNRVIFDSTAVEQLLNLYFLMPFVCARRFEIGFWCTSATYRLSGFAFDNQIIYIIPFLKIAKQVVSCIPWIVFGRASNSSHFSAEGKYRICLSW